MNITANSINVRHVLTMNMLNTFEMSHDVMLDLLLLIQCISIFMTNNTFRFETCMKKTSLIFNLVEITVRSKERNIQSISSRCCSLRWLFKLTIIDLLSSSECKSVLSAELTWWIPNLTIKQYFHWLKFILRLFAVTCKECGIKCFKNLSWIFHSNQKYSFFPSLQIFTMLAIIKALSVKTWGFSQFEVFINVFHKSLLSRCDVTWDYCYQSK